MGNKIENVANLKTHAHRIILDKKSYIQNFKTGCGGTYEIILDENRALVSHLLSL
jgi:hypothetical protein